MRKQSGQITTVLTLVALGLMALGIGAATWLTQNSSSPFYSKATEGTCENNCYYDYDCGYPAAKCVDVGSKCHDGQNFTGKKCYYDYDCDYPAETCEYFGGECRCKSGYSCIAGACVKPTPTATKTPADTPTPTTLSQCTTNANCDDANPCTADTCDNGTCQNPNLNGTACNVGDVIGTCNNGICVTTTPAVECETGGDCPSGICCNNICCASSSEVCTAAGVCITPDDTPTPEPPTSTPTATPTLTPMPPDTCQSLGGNWSCYISIFMPCDQTQLAPGGQCCAGYMCSGYCCLILPTPTPTVTSWPTSTPTSTSTLTPTPTTTGATATPAPTCSPCKIDQTGACNPACCCLGTGVGCTGGEVCHPNGYCNEGGSCVTPTPGGVTNTPTPTRTPPTPTTIPTPVCTNPCVYDADCSQTCLPPKYCDGDCCCPLPTPTPTPRCPAGCVDYGNSGLCGERCHTDHSGWSCNGYCCCPLPTPTPTPRCSAGCVDYGNAVLCGEKCHTDHPGWSCNGYCCCLPSGSGRPAVQRIEETCERDGRVTTRDYVLLLGNYGECGEDVTGDVNGDGCVNALDLSDVVTNIGATLE